MISAESNSIKNSLLVHNGNESLPSKLNSCAGPRLLAFIVGLSVSFIYWAVYQGWTFAFLVLFGQVELTFKAFWKPILFIFFALTCSAIMIAWALVKMLAPWLAEDNINDDNDILEDKNKKKEKRDSFNAFITHGILGHLVGYSSFDFFLTKRVFKYLTGIQVDYGLSYVVAMIATDVFVMMMWMWYTRRQGANRAMKSDNSAKHMSASRSSLAQIM